MTRDVTFLLSVIEYYAIVGIGFGVLGVILVYVFGGGAFVSVLLPLLVLTFAVLSGPILAVTVSTVTFGRGVTRARANAIANGIGFLAFALVVGVVLLVGVSLVGSGGEEAVNGGGATPNGGESEDDGGLFGLTDVLLLAILMAIPNGFVGGGITVWLSSAE